VAVAQFDRAGVLAGYVGAEAQHDHLRRVAGKGLTPEVHALARVADGVHAMLEVEGAPVAGRAGFKCIMPGQVDEQIAERLIGAHRLVVAGPQRDVVELQVLARRLAEHHRADAAVPDRQRLALPAARRIGRRLVVAQRKVMHTRERGRRRGSQDDGGDDRHHQQREAREPGHRVLAAAAGLP
jgi:hypothetical protein